MSDETQAVAVRPGTLMATMLELARDKNFDATKFEALANLQLKMEDRAADRALADAIQAIQSEIPPVRKDGKIPKKGGEFIPFATFENVMSVLQPYLTQHGIAITFSSDFQATKFIVTATARKGEASITAAVPLPIDEGPGRNTTQSHVSSLSYGRRNAIESLFNIIRVGSDDDGASAHHKTMDQQDVTVLLDLLKTGGGSEAALLAHFYGDKYHSLDEVPAGDFVKLGQAVRDRNQAVAAKRAKEG